MLRDSSPRDINIKSHIEEAVLRNSSPRDTNTNSLIVDAVSDYQSS